MVLEWVVLAAQAQEVLALEGPDGVAGIVPDAPEADLQARVDVPSLGVEVAHVGLVEDHVVEPGRVVEC